jgi:hypothetical protein
VLCLNLTKTACLERGVGENAEPLSCIVMQVVPTPTRLSPRTSS